LEDILRTAYSPRQLTTALNACIRYKEEHIGDIVLSQTVIGRITNYRIGIRTQQSKECLIEFNNMDAAAAGQLVGHKVIWRSGKSKHAGKIIGLHGRKGAVRVRFARPVPGQAIGTIVELIG
jgi:large subunit ribosomal protein L35Ae